MGSAIYDLMSQQGRLRLTQTGEQKQRREWGFSMISNGEISVMDIVGDNLKGGQMVRLMDVEIEKGELTIDAGHANRIKQSFWGSAVQRGSYGHASDQWIHYLIERGAKNIYATWQFVRDRLEAEFPEGNAEDGRMLNAIAIIGTALVEGVRSRLLDWPEDASMETTLWVARKVIGGRSGEMDTPERRMLKRWNDLIETEPGKFPNDTADRLPPVVYGYRVTSGNKSYIYTTEAMLNKTGLPQMVGVSARRFFGWAAEKGMVINGTEREYIAGTRQRWKMYKIE